MHISDHLRNYFDDVADRELLTIEEWFPLLGGVRDAIYRILSRSVPRWSYTPEKYFNISIGIYDITLECVTILKDRNMIDNGWKFYFSVSADGTAGRGHVTCRRKSSLDLVLDYFKSGEVEIHELGYTDYIVSCHVSELSETMQRFISSIVKR